MSTAIFSSNGRITIPKSVRDRLGIHSGDRVEFIEMGSGVFHFIAASRDVRLLKGIVSKPTKVVSVEEMNDILNVD